MLSFGPSILPLLLLLLLLLSTCTKTCVYALGPGKGGVFFATEFILNLLVVKFVLFFSVYHPCVYFFFFFFL